MPPILTRILWKPTTVAAGNWNECDDIVSLKGIGALLHMDVVPFDQSPRSHERAFRVIIGDSSRSLFAETEHEGWSLLSWHGHLHYLGKLYFFNLPHDKLPQSFNEIDPWIRRFLNGYGFQSEDMELSAVNPEKEPEPANFDYNYEKDGVNNKKVTFNILDFYKLVMFFKSIRWGASKDDVKTLFSEVTELPPHPTQNAIGFVAQYYGVPTTIVCYFRPTLFGSKLSRVGLAFFEERPSDDVVEALHIKIKNDLMKFYGEPRRKVMDNPSTPKEFRQSEISVWVLDSSVIELSLSLLRDGVSYDSAPIAIGYGDSKNDPISKIFSH